jgi:hypothetical protein
VEAGYSALLEGPRKGCPSPLGAGDDYVAAIFGHFSLGARLNRAAKSSACPTWEFQSRPLLLNPSSGLVYPLSRASIAISSAVWLSRTWTQHREAPTMTRKTFSASISVAPVFA